MSFVDLMASDIWSEADIVRRTEALIRSEFPLEAETILNRKAMGAVLGTYLPTEAEQAELIRYQTVVEAARVAGEEARVDMALLIQVFPLEEAARRLQLPPLVPTEDYTPTEEELAKDAEERAAAQEVLDNAPEDVKELFLLRSPPVAIPVEE